MNAVSVEHAALSVTLMRLVAMDWSARIVCAKQDAGQMPPVVTTKPVSITSARTLVLSLANAVIVPIVRWSIMVSNAVARTDTKETHLPVANSRFKGATRTVSATKSEFSAPKHVTMTRSAPVVRLVPMENAVPVAIPVLVPRVSCAGMVRVLRVVVWMPIVPMTTHASMGNVWTHVSGTVLAEKMLYAGSRIIESCACVRMDSVVSLLKSVPHLNVKRTATVNLTSGAMVVPVRTRAWKSTRVEWMRNVGWYVTMPSALAHRVMLEILWSNAFKSPQEHAYAIHAVVTPFATSYLPVAMSVLAMRVVWVIQNVVAYAKNDKSTLVRTWNAVITPDVASWVIMSLNAIVLRTTLKGTPMFNVS